MKRVLLIGDSIRMSYEKTVQQALSDVAEVWGPADNGGHTVNVLMHWHLWVLRQKPDVVHINAGLHDLKTLHYDGRDNLVPLEHYRANIETLIRITRGLPGTTILWATTTPVRDEQAHRTHAQWQDCDRFNIDVCSYNRAAVEVCQNFNVPVNDLYSAVEEAPNTFSMSDDGVHFAPGGAEALGRRVATFIGNYI